MRLDVFAASCLIACTASTLLAHPDDPKIRDHQPPYVGPSFREAIDGPYAGGEMRGPNDFTFKGIALISWLTLSDLSGLTGQSQQNGNDCWGYTAPSGREYAIMGLSSGTAFVEITDPANAQYIGYVDGPNSLWRDIKVYQHFAYAVSEGGGGIQVIDMSNIDDVANRITLVNTITSDGSLATTSTHNVVINEESGFLYRCGGGSNGLRIYSLANPATPQFVGQWTDRYVHDCQVVNYTSGPFAGREIAICCSGFNGGSSQTGLDFLDVTDKQNIINLYPSRLFWSNPGYSHQVWLSADRNYAYVNDELDESNFNLNTRTIVVDVRFLQDGAFNAPSVASTFTSPSTAIGHNLYTVGNLIFEANYRSGLRISCAENPTSPYEIAYFDTYPADDAANFNGAWSSYPYFPSGTVIVSDLERGLFVLDISSTTKALAIDFPQGRPAFVNPSGGTAIQVSVGPVPCGLTPNEPTEVTLSYDAGGGFVTVPMTNVGGDEFEATFGASECWQNIPYYISAVSSTGTTYTSPWNAPFGVYATTSATADILINNDDFENANGWAPIAGGAIAGAWQRGVPVNDPNWGYDPISDADGSGQCWLTQNTPGDSDIDGGTVRLLSPTLDMTATGAHVSYYYFLRMENTNNGDGLVLDISNNGNSGPWTRIRSFVLDGGLAWHSDALDTHELIANGITPTNNMRFRFSASDTAAESIVEAGLDGFRLASVDCVEPCPAADGDLTEDGLVDGQDVMAFTAAILGTPSVSDICHGDFSNDATLTENDVPDFVAALLVP